MDVQIWSDVNVEVPTQLGTKINITGISNAAEAVASLAANHGLVKGDAVVLRVRGMRELDYKVVRVGAVEGANVTLSGVDTRSSKAFNSGHLQKVVFDVVAETFTDVTPSGGTAEDVNVRTIHNRQDFSVPGNSAPLVYEFGSLWGPADPASARFKTASLAREVLPVRFGFIDGTEVLMAGVPSTSGAPAGSAGAVVTDSVRINVRGELTAYFGAGV